MTAVESGDPKRQWPNMNWETVLKELVAGK